MSVSLRASVHVFLCVDGNLGRVWCQFADLPLLLYGVKQEFKLFLVEEKKSAHGRESQCLFSGNY